MKSDDERYWAAQRARIGLDAGVINLNTGTCGPVPLSVQRLVTELRTRLYNSPSDFCWRELPPRLERARAALAKFVNVDPLDLLLIANATIGLNIVVKSLDLPPGSEVVTTNYEYGAMKLLLEHMERERGWVLRTAELPTTSENPRDYVDAITSAFNEKTRLVFFSHITSPTGLVLPVSEICRRAGEAGAFSIVDGAHGPGLTAVDLRAIGADVYAANVHKWLMAPLGAAFVHIRRELREMMKPLVTSWGYGYNADASDRDSEWGGSYWQRNLEFHGTLDRCPHLVLPEILTFRASLDDTAARKRQRYLAGRLRSHFASIGLDPATPMDDRLSAGLVAFHVPRVDPVAARNYIWNKFRLEAPFTTAAGKTFWRFSTAWFNSVQEIDRAAEIAAQMPWDALKT